MLVTRTSKRNVTDCVVLRLARTKRLDSVRVLASCRAPAAPASVAQRPTRKRPKKDALRSTSMRQCVAVEAQAPHTAARAPQCCLCSLVHCSPPLSDVCSGSRSCRVESCRVGTLVNLVSGSGSGSECAREWASGSMLMGSEQREHWGEATVVLHSSCGRASYSQEPQWIAVNAVAECRQVCALQITSRERVALLAWAVLLPLPLRRTFLSALFGRVALRQALHAATADRSHCLLWQCAESSVAVTASYSYSILPVHTPGGHRVGGGRWPHASGWAELRGGCVKLESSSCCGRCGFCLRHSSGGQSSIDAFIECLFVSLLIAIADVSEFGTRTARVECPRECSLIRRCVYARTSIGDNAQFLS